MIGKLVRHIEFDAIGIVVDHFVCFTRGVGSEWEGGYKIKFLKPHPPIGDLVSPFETIIGKASNFEEVINESR